MLQNHTNLCSIFLLVKGRVMTPQAHKKGVGRGLLTPNMPGYLSSRVRAQQCGGPVHVQVNIKAIPQLGDEPYAVCSCLIYRVPLWSILSHVTTHLHPMNVAFSRGTAEPMASPPVQHISAPPRSMKEWGSVVH